MKVLREVTEDWTVDFMPNHTYLVEGDVIIAYKPWHDDPIQHLKSGKIKLDKRRRKFKELPFVASEWGIEQPKPTSDIVEVAGSKGNVYRVNISAETCNCPGNTYRGYCKHIEMAKSMVDSQAA